LLYPGRAIHGDRLARDHRAPAAEFHLDSIRNQMLVFAVVATLVPTLA